MSAERVAVPGPRMTISSSGLEVVDAAGRVVSRTEFPPEVVGAGLRVSCDCCERLPRGTVAAVVELLGGDRPDVAALLRAAVVVE